MAATYSVQISYLALRSDSFVFGCYPSGRFLQAYRMEISIRKAVESDVESLSALYDEIIDRQGSRPDSPKWTKGVYPTESLLRSETLRGEIMVALVENKIVAAVIYNHTKAHGYEKAPWKVEATDDEVYFIHTLGVHPDCQKMGLGSALVKAVEREGKEKDIKAVRMDVILQNMPSARMCLSLGYNCLGTFMLEYDSVPPQPFKLFEKVL